MKTLLRRLSALLLAAALLLTPALALTPEQAIELLEAHYLEALPQQAYEAATLEELMALISDPYTVYYSAEEYQEFLSRVEGGQTFTGIGTAIQFTPEGILVTEVLAGGGAQQAGIQAGDLIIAVDGVSCIPANETHQALILGEEGTEVVITVLREGQTLDFTIVRKTIHIPSTTISLKDGYLGYINCDTFAEDTGSTFGFGVNEHAQQAELWLVDLRGNTGGVTNSAVEALGSFAGPGCYLYLRSRQGQLYGYYNRLVDQTDSPLIVLVDGNTASAAEAMAAGVRDTGVGILVGGRTYGKGIAQIIRDSSTDPEYFTDDALKITTYRFYSVLGNTNDKMGVLPTLMVSNAMAASVADALCAAPSQAGEGWLQLSLENNVYYIDPARSSAETFSALLSALPPAAVLRRFEGTSLRTITPEEAAALLGAEPEWRRFDDLADSPYADEIHSLATYALVLGNGEGSFLPDEQLTRAQGCAMLVHLLGDDLVYSGSSYFTDVPQDAWYANAVNVAAHLGLVKGVGDGRFLPDVTLSYQEFYTMLSRLARYLNFSIDNHAQNLASQPLSESLRDKLAGFADWATMDVLLLEQAGEAIGVVGSVLPNALPEIPAYQPISRGEAAACLYRLLSLTGILPN